MPRVDVVGLGMCCLDVVIKLGEMPTWERGGQVTGFAIQGGGPAGTAMAAAARLGAKSGYIGPFGNDAQGNMKADILRTQGVDVSRAVTQDHPERQIAIVYVHEDSAERVFAPLADLFSQRLEPEQLDLKYLSQAAYLLLDGFYPEAAIRASHCMHTHGKKVVLDMEKPADGIKARISELVRLSDILICGEGGLAYLSGQKDLPSAAQAVLEMGPEVIVETRGHAGCHTFSGQDRFHTHAFRVPAVNTTGAGDVFHGAYIAGLLRGMDLGATALFAAAASALTCTKFQGPERIPDVETVRKFLADNGNGVQNRI